MKQPRNRAWVGRIAILAPLLCAGHHVAHADSDPPSATPDGTPTHIVLLPDQLEIGLSNSGTLWIDVMKGRDTLIVQYVSSHEYEPIPIGTIVIDGPTGRVFTRKYLWDCELLSDGHTLVCADSVGFRGKNCDDKTAPRRKKAARGYNDDDVTAATFSFGEAGYNAFARVLSLDLDTGKESEPKLAGGGVLWSSGAATYALTKPLYFLNVEQMDSWSRREDTSPCPPNAQELVVGAKLSWKGVAMTESLCDSLRDKRKARYEIDTAQDWRDWSGNRIQADFPEVGTIMAKTRDGRFGIVVSSSDSGTVVLQAAKFVDEATAKAAQEEQQAALMEKCVAFCKNNSAKAGVVRICLKDDSVKHTAKECDDMYVKACVKQACEHRGAFE